MKNLWLRWVVELYCVFVGHKEKHCGSEYWHEDGHEYDDWWECTRCKNDLSNYYPMDTFMGRLKSWWYQE